MSVASRRHGLSLVREPGTRRQASRGGSGSGARVDTPAPRRLACAGLRADWPTGGNRPRPSRRWVGVETLRPPALGKGTPGFWLEAFSVRGEGLFVCPRSLTAISGRLGRPLPSEPSRLRVSYGGRPTWRPPTELPDVRGGAWLRPGAMATPDRRVDSPCRLPVGSAKAVSSGRSGAPGTPVRSHPARLPARKTDRGPGNALVGLHRVRRETAGPPLLGKEVAGGVVRSPPGAECTVAAPSVRKGPFLFPGSPGGRP